MNCKSTKIKINLILLIFQKVTSFNKVIEIQLIVDLKYNL